MGRSTLGRAARAMPLDLPGDFGSQHGCVPASAPDPPIQLIPARISFRPPFCGKDCGPAGWHCRSFRDKLLTRFAVPAHYRRLTVERRISVCLRRRDDAPHTLPRLGNGRHVC
jgi:hypothetical protein